MDWQTLVAAALRHALTTAAGSLVAHGYIMGSEQEQFIGGGMLIAGLIWSWYQKRGQAMVADELARMKAKAAPVPLTPKSGPPNP